MLRYSTKLRSGGAISGGAWQIGSSWMIIICPCLQNICILIFLADRIFLKTYMVAQHADSPKLKSEILVNLGRTGAAMLSTVCKKLACHIKAIVEQTKN